MHILKLEIMAINNTKSFQLCLYKKVKQANIIHQ